MHVHVHVLVVSASGRTASLTRQCVSDLDICARLCMTIVGYSKEEDEFRRRVQHMYDSGMHKLFQKDDKTGQWVMSHYNLRSEAFTAHETKRHKMHHSLPTAAHQLQPRIILHALES